MPSRQAASSLIQYVPLSLSEAEPQQQQQPPSLAFLIALNSFAFAYCLVVSTLGIVSRAPPRARSADAFQLSAALRCTHAGHPSDRGDIALCRPPPGDAWLHAGMHWCDTAHLARGGVHLGP
eukprot:scaffold248696_cov33-Tisochrysis_lutea.AAC.2